MRSPTAVLAEDTLRVSALVDDTESAQASIDALQLPESVQRHVRLERIDSGISAQSLCARQFGPVATPPIRFEESGTVLRQSAFPALEKIAALADAWDRAEPVS